MPTLTPPVLTAPSEIRLSRAGTLTFTDSAAWRTAITAVRLGGSYLTVTADYTVAAGVITILGTVINKIGTYTLTIEATGYDDATADLLYVVCDWSSLTLFTTAEITALEPAMVDSAMISAIAISVKTEIMDNIASRFADIQNDLDDEVSGINIHDNIRDIRLLRQCARSLCVSMAMGIGRVSIDSDVAGSKAVEYRIKSMREFSQWAAISPFDLGDYTRAHGTVRFIN